MKRMFALAAGFATGLALAPIAADAATVDFTDSSIWGGGGTSIGPVAIGSTGLMVTAAANGGNTISTQAFDGSTIDPNPCVNLACSLDGLGLNNDEISYGGAEILRLTFSAPTTVTQISYLDLFGVNTRTGDRVAETAQFATDTGTFGAITSNLASPDRTGYVIQDVALVGVTWIDFFADDGTLSNGFNSSSTNTDFAVASITVTLIPTPIPAALPLMLTGFAVLGLIGRRRMQAAA